MYTIPDFDKRLRFILSPGCKPTVVVTDSDVGVECLTERGHQFAGRPQDQTRKLKASADMSHKTICFIYKVMIRCKRNRKLGNGVIPMAHNSLIQICSWINNRWW